MHWAIWGYHSQGFDLRIVDPIIVCLFLSLLEGACESCLDVLEFGLAGILGKFGLIGLGGLSSNECSRWMPAVLNEGQFY